MPVKVRFYDEDKFFYRELAMKPEDFFEFRTQYAFRAINREATGVPAPRLGEKILYSSGSEHFGDGSEEIESDDEADPEQDYEDLEDYGEGEQEEHSLDEENDGALDDSDYNAREVDGRDCDQDVRDMMEQDRQKEAEEWSDVGTESQSKSDTKGDINYPNNQAKYNPNKKGEPKNRTNFVGGKISNRASAENKNDAAFLDSLFLFESEFEEVKKGHNANKQVFDSVLVGVNEPQAQEWSNKTSKPVPKSDRNFNKKLQRAGLS